MAILKASDRRYSIGDLGHQGIRWGGEGGGCDAAGRDGCLWGSRGGARKIPDRGPQRGVREDDFFRRGAADPLRPKEKCGGGSRVLSPRKRLPPSRMCPPPQGYASPRPKKAAPAGLGLRPLFSGLALDPRHTSCCPHPAFSAAWKQQNPLASASGFWYTSFHWGCSSAGRAPALHAGGHRFNPVHLHHTFVFVPVSPV